MVQELKSPSLLSLEVFSGPLAALALGLMWWAQARQGGLPVGKHLAFLGLLGVVLCVWVLVLRRNLRGGQN